MANNTRLENLRLKLIEDHNALTKELEAKDKDIEARRTERISIAARLDALDHFIDQVEEQMKPKGRSR